jgi:hypothetical protein
MNMGTAEQEQSGVTIPSKFEELLALVKNEIVTEEEAQ